MWGDSEPLKASIIDLFTGKCTYVRGEVVAPTALIRKFTHVPSSLKTFSISSVLPQNTFLLFLLFLSLHLTYFYVLYFADRFFYLLTFLYSIHVYIYAFKCANKENTNFPIYLSHETLWKEEKFPLKVDTKKTMQNKICTYDSLGSKMLFKD